MGLIADGKVMIEVGLNEWATKAQNPNVPYGIDEVIASGAACASAGAAILHFHSRADDGSQLWTSAEVYRAEMEGIAARGDVIMYPSYNADFVHIWDLLDHPPVEAPMDIVPFDVYQGVGNVLWDDSTKSFRERFSDIKALSAHKAASPPELTEMLRRRVLPTVCASELGELRWTRHAIEAGLIQAPVSLKLFMRAGQVKGAEPTPNGIDALLTHVTPEMEPLIVPSAMTSRRDTEALLRHAMRRGAHIRVGIGDNPVAFPTETNAELVEWAVELAADEGLEPATPADVRAYFGGVGVTL
jgi:3-keto-5-aminohexanoate cleavage enzyme